MGIDLPNRDVTNGTQAYPMEGTDLPNENSNEQGTDLPNENSNKQGTDLPKKIVTINERDTDVPNKNRKRKWHRPTK